jgi:glycine cleavage system H protein
MVPDDVRYSSDHEWVRVATDGTGGTARIGITDYAQNSLGDIVYVQMPEPGTMIAAGDAVGEVESTKSVSDIVAPVSATVVARNEALDATPELVNTDPYGDGWMIEVELADPSELDGLLDAAGYAALIGEG